MELLELQPPEYGVRASGIYVVDDDGSKVCAGPFKPETDALATYHGGIARRVVAGASAGVAEAAE